MHNMHPVPTVSKAYLLRSPSLTDINLDWGMNKKKTSTVLWRVYLFIHGLISIWVKAWTNTYILLVYVDVFIYQCPKLRAGLVSRYW